MAKPFELYRLDDHYPDYFSSDRQGRGDNDGSGYQPGPLGDNELKSLFKALEKALPDLRERMVPVETKLGGMDKVMATKSDICA
ncbi:hypothetical protein [Pseudomonas gessardii]|uniref:hypothetical protein n=1 Tax=Pseudomonas gessardii TaxID=78544 RepID=UPI0014735A41|nr:hypothetical protein [Pseudomonas gessardii]NNA66229.1 hypothetical protein [Pseudomonas gessardii]